MTIQPPSSSLCKTYCIKPFLLKKLVLEFKQVLNRLNSFLLAEYHCFVHLTFSIELYQVGQQHARNQKYFFTGVSSNMQCAENFSIWTAILYESHRATRGQKNAKHRKGKKRRWKKSAKEVKEQRSQEQYQQYRRRMRNEQRRRTRVI